MKKFPDITDPAFLEAYEIAKSATLTSVERMDALFQAVCYVVRSGVPGAFVECGVWKGGSAMMIALTLRSLGVTDRDIVLFDTFDKFPLPGPEDVDFNGTHADEFFKSAKHKDGRGLWESAPLDEVMANLRRTGYDMSRFLIRRGDVMNTIPHQVPDAIALLRLDTDWYESTKHELQHLFPRLSPRGVLIVDDYGHFKGARKAVDAYFASQPIPYLLNRIDYTGRMLVKA